MDCLPGAQGQLGRKITLLRTIGNITSWNNNTWWEWTLSQLTLSWTQWKVQSDLCICGLVGWFYLISDQSGNCQENGGGFRARRALPEPLPGRSHHAPQDKAAHWSLHWSVELSQRMTGTIFLKVVIPWTQEPSLNLFYGIVPTQNEGQGGHAVLSGKSSQPRRA